MDQPKTLFDWVPRWHPRWRVCRAPAPGAGLVLVAEEEVLRFEAPEVGLVAELVDAGRSVAEQRVQGLPLDQLPGLLQALDVLLRQGYLSDSTEVWRTPDFSAPVLTVPMGAGSDLTLLSQILPLHEALETCRKLSEGLNPGPLHWVLCDDYLDPRIGALAERWRRQSRPWLLLKCSGVRTWIGPVWGRQGEGQPCWHCLRHRLQRNQPARALLAGEPERVASGWPVLADAAPALARLGSLQAPLAALLRAPGTEIRRQEANGHWTTHTVQRRPQCPCCGDPGLQGDQQRRPIRPAPVVKLAGVSGGERPQSSAATVAQLMPHVDPVCGLVASLSPLPQRVNPPGLTVYRSSFFRSPTWALNSPDGAWVQVCLGKGLSDEQARASALCEAVERYATGLQGDEAVVQRPIEQLDAPAWGPERLVFFSAAQRARSATAAQPSAGEPLPLAPGQALAWVPAWSLSRDAACYLPQAFCYPGAGPEHGQHLRWTSNGCASGNRLEDAIWQGFLELVERDASAIWWYNRLLRPAFEAEALPPTLSDPIRGSLGEDWEHWVLDITHDLGIPVAAAVGRHRHSGDWALGFGAAAKPALACERALTELLQLVAAGKQLPAHSLGPSDAPLDFLRPEPRQARAPRHSVDPSNQQLDQDIAAGVRAASACGLEVLVHDYSRPDIPLRSVKVVMPGACHIWPELANSRLYNVPVRMGWLSRALSEHELNPVALFV